MEFIEDLLTFARLLAAAQEEICFSRDEYERWASAVGMTRQELERWLERAEEIQEEATALKSQILQ